MMKTFEEQLFIYQQQHQNPTNQLTHFIGIPLIIFSILMLLNWISIDIARTWQLSFSWILLMGALIYYFILNARIALLTTIIMIPFTFIATWIAHITPTVFSGTLFLILFIGGWALQFTGHYFEKQKPAFFESVTQLLIGPIFVLLELLKVLKLDGFFIEKNS